MSRHVLGHRKTKMDPGITWTGQDHMNPVYTLNHIQLLNLFPFQREINLSPPPL